MQFEAADRLVLVTDGVLEAGAPGPECAEDRLYTAPAGRMARHDRSVTSPAALPAEVEPAVFDAQRLAAVERTGLLDSAASELFDSLTSLATQLLHAPMAFLTLVDDRRSFWLSTDGVADGRENPVEESFCQYVIADRAPLVIGDATADTRVCNNPGAFPFSWTPDYAA